MKSLMIILLSYLLPCSQRRPPDILPEQGEDGEGPLHTNSPWTTPSMNGKKEGEKFSWMDQSMFKGEVQ